VVSFNADAGKTLQSGRLESGLLRWLVLVGLPLCLLMLCWCLQPFSTVLVSKTYSIQSLNQAQITNLRVAARHLDGLVLQPGDRFSFNRVIGPRTAPRGYRPAPSYLGGESPASMGGGICLLSSAVYQLALEAGLPIQERIPHLRTIHSVPPGLDATVWYGRADLQFTNSLSIPVRVSAKLHSGALALALQGEKAIEPPAIQRVTRRLSPEQVQVTVLRAGQVVSSDRYRLSSGG
jgi:vancomycin resistance protein VanW